MLRWLAHQGTFSTPDGRLADVFHELTLAFDRAHHRLQNVRMLDHGEADELVTTLNLHPILEVLDRLNAHQPQQLDIALPTPPSVPKSEQPDIAKPEQRNRVKLHEPNPGAASQHRIDPIWSSSRPGFRFVRNANDTANAVHWRDTPSPPPHHWMTRGSPRSRAGSVSDCRWTEVLPDKVIRWPWIPAATTSASTTAPPRPILRWSFLATDDPDAEAERLAGSFTELIDSLQGS